MEKIKIILGSLTFIIAIIGVVIAKGNETKRGLSTQAYFRNASNTSWISITTGTATFDQQGTSCQACIYDKNCSPVCFYLTQSTSNPASFTQP